ncbi:single-stranded DNA-binding protein [Lacihabitans sp. LS3-19]|uniref:single-stranded DNA-binding protein n=1 Tax=Lacihabitans sp. LS3-19 TaxID=2487335 RepID=UPI0020CC577F|nr:single-stranded DNA-binding protein [Lacihabitans sp. LS3-19]MCP9768067.1 single-stranded DNA-binding protein [Lacihabitans sp. LS3-19]
MASLNKVLLIGNLGSDPEIRTLPSGAKVASFNIATTESYKNKEGQKVESTEWHRIELWEGLAGIAEQYLKKGDSVYIEGRIKTEKYTDANGVEKFSFRIRGNSMQMLGKPNRDGENSNQKNYVAANQAAAVPSQVADGDDLPF